MKRVYTIEIEHIDGGWVANITEEEGRSTGKHIEGQPTVLHEVTNNIGLALRDAVTLAILKDTDEC